MANPNDPKNPPVSTEVSELRALIAALVEGQKSSAEAQIEGQKVLAKAIQEGIATGLAMAEMQRQKSVDGDERAREERKNLGPPCPKCLQRWKVCGGPEYIKADGTRTMASHEKDAKGEVTAQNQMTQGEDKNHVFMLVLPQGKRAAKAFQGMFINGVPYLSLTRGSPVLVPRSNDIAWQLQEVTRNAEAEQESRSAEWDSGEVGSRAQRGQRKALEHGGINFAKAN